jgi:hypothetical protein
MALAFTLLLSVDEERVNAGKGSWSSLTNGENEEVIPHTWVEVRDVVMSTQVPPT